MEKTNDMMLATVRNPGAKLFDFLDNDINPENTRLLDKDEYKSKNFIKDAFTDEEGTFNEEGFNNAYKLALHNYNQISDEIAIKDLDKVKYNPFDTTRPLNAGKTWNTDVNFSVDNNPYKQLYSRDGVNTVTESNWSMRELAQKGQIYDTNTGKFLDSVNKRSFFDRVFGETLVYAQWDEDGVHKDPITGNTVKHKKGDWKLDQNGDFHLETLGNREVYGKQVVASTDILTTDGSLFNKIDVFDADGKEKSVGKVAARAVIEIAPFLTPAGTVYGGIRAATSLLGVLPTFYKSIESLLRGDSVNYGKDPITKMEGWMSKFNAESTSDRGSESMWNFEQMSNMVTSIFSQIYEQRAMASLSKVLVRPDKLLNQEVQALKVKTAVAAKHYNVDVNDALETVLKKSSTVQKAYRKQTQLSKSLSLGYMALTATGSVYGDALEGGYDRRTAGFAALLTAAGQYGVMSASDLGTWFLDETTGFEVDVSKGAFRKAAKDVMQEIDDVFTNSKLSTAQKRGKLADIAVKFKKGVDNIFSSSGMGGNITQNMIKEGFEEVAEQMVEDASKGIIDVMSHLGLTKQQGSFGVAESYESGEAFQEYLANFVGGLLGGALFELERTKITPFLKNKKFSPEVHKNITELVASGYKDQVIEAIKKEGKLLSNNYLSLHETDGDFQPAEKLSQADVVVQKTIEVVEYIDSLLNQDGTKLTDDEIIHKAIRTQVVMQGLESSREEGKRVGIEGLVIDDFRNNAAKLAEIRAQLNELEKTDDTAEQIKLLEEQAKPYVDKIENILSGEYGMHYFDQIAVYLNPDIKELFGSLDRESFIQAKYGESYENLPDEGFTLTKAKAEEEWQNFVDSTDLKSKLEIITKVYKDLEATMNDPIKQYIESGYIDERKRVSQDIIDLDDTLKKYITETDEGKKRKLFNNFIAINKSLEEVGLLKTMPFDSYISDLADQLFELNLIKKTTEDEEGNITYSDYTEEELDAILGENTSLRDNIKFGITNAAKVLPFNPFNLSSAIELINGAVQHHNEKVSKDLADLSASQDENKEANMQALSSQFLNYTVQQFDDNALRQRVLKTMDADMRGLLKEVGQTYAPHDADLTEDELIDLGIRESREYEYLLEALPRLLKPNQDFKTFNDYIQEVLEDQSLDIEIAKGGLSNIEVASLLNNLKASGILKLIADNSEHWGDVQKEILTKIDDNFYTALGLVQESLAEVDEYWHGIALDSDMNKFATMLIFEAEKALTKFNTLYQDTNAKNAYERIQSAKPKLVTPHNYAFDILVEALNSGYYDKELYIEAKAMFEEEAKAAVKKVFPDLENINQTLIDQVLSGKIDIQKTAEKWDDHLRKYSEALGVADVDERAEYENIQTLLEDTKGYDWSIELEEGDSLLLNALGDMWAFDAQDILNKAAKLQKDYTEEFAKLSSFNNIQTSALKANPLYDMIRKFTMTMDSNYKSKVNTVFDILAREELSFKSASTVESFLSDGIRSDDIDQATHLLDLMATVLNNMSTTSMVSGEMSGFIAMRQNYAKQSKLEDDVTNLFTVDSDQAYAMKRDLGILRNKLDFIKGLAKHNSTQISNEHQAVRSHMYKLELGIWDNLVKDSSMAKYIPTEMADILNSSEPDEVKKIKAETAFYDHNKGNKLEAVKDILSNTPNVNWLEVQPFSLDLTEATYDPYTSIIYLISNLSLRSADDAKRMIISLEGTFDKAPFYSQEFASKIVRAHVNSPELFNQIFIQKELADAPDARHWSFIIGAGGSGKTTVTAGQIIDIIRQSNNKSRIWLSGPRSNQSKKLHGDVIRTVTEEGLDIDSFNKDDLFSQFGPEILRIRNEMQEELTRINDMASDTDDVKSLKYFEIRNNKVYTKINEEDGVEWADYINYEELPNMLIVDEVTHYSQAELLLLNFIADQSYNNDSSRYMKLVGLGDDNQMGFKAKDGKNGMAFNLGGLAAIRTPPLVLSVRSQNDQKRHNMDMMLGVVNKIDNIFKHEIAKTDYSYDRAERTAQTELISLGNALSMKYYLKDNFKGDYMTNTGIDPALGKILLDELKQDKSIGIITSNGTIPDSTKAQLEASGFTQADLDKITIFTPDNVQGSEVDYIIFDTNTIDPTQNLRDTMKAFYTFTSRSTQGSVIIDSNNALQNRLYFSNAKPSEYVVPYTPLDEETINNLKEERIENLKKAVENTDVSEEHNFKWRDGTVAEEPIIIEEDKKDDPTSAQKQMPSGKQIIPVSEGIDPISEDSAASGVKISEEDFGVMVHSFYNNANAELEWVEDKLHSIRVNRAKSHTDLNGVSNVTDSEEATAVFNEWASLKTELFNDLSAEVITARDYPAFLKHINGGEVNGNQRFNVSFVTTASKYDPNTNSPQKKFGNVVTDQLSANDLLVTLSAKIEVGDKVHYVTLAVFPKLGTFNSAVDTFLDADKNPDRKTEIKNGATKMLKDAKALLDQDGAAPLIELKKVKKDDLKLITSTRLLNLDEKHYLSDIKKDFPGMTHSEIRVFPAGVDTGRKDYIKLIQSYTFGKQRTPEDISKSWTRTSSTKDGTPFKVKQNGKPYIVVSFGGANSGINGSKSDNNPAQILTIGAESRPMNTLLEEIAVIKGDLRQHIENHRKDKSNNPFKFPGEINARFETLLDRNQILDILIQWYQDGTLHYLTDEVEIRTESYGFGQKSSVIELLDKYNLGGSSTKTTEAFKGVVDLVNKHMSGNKDPKDAKKAIISDSRKIVGWSWSFYNIFDFDNVLKTLKYNDETDNIHSYGVNFSSLISEDTFNNLKKNAQELTKSASIVKEKGNVNRSFYYSIPLQRTSDGNYAVNSYISGKDGEFLNKFFADKFFFTQTPEGARAILPIDFFTDSKGIVSEVVKNTKKPMDDEIVVEETPTEQGNSTEEILASTTGGSTTDILRSVKSKLNAMFVDGRVENKHIDQMIVSLDTFMDLSKDAIDPDITKEILTVWEQLLPDVRTLGSFQDPVTHFFDFLGNLKRFSEDNNHPIYAMDTLLPYSASPGIEDIGVTMILYGNALNMLSESSEDALDDMFDISAEIIEQLKTCN